VLWRKGETSGNVLALVSVELDCDGDALLIRARPAGPTCHTGARSCFDADAAPDEDGVPAGSGSGQGFAWLERLWDTIEERGRTRPEGSYTSRLLDGGVDAVARKVAEEATEVVMAAKDDEVAERLGEERPRGELAGELADLLYHALVLCAERGMPPGQVIDALKARHRA
jgi:phosphoribosyl-ATP pyrophosphohydrolase/phosphoribosyl-AMP cyclohydrolase